MIRLVAIDDHPVITEGLARWADQLTHLELVGVANSLHDLPLLLEDAPEPDVLVLDYRMPGVTGVDSIVDVARRGLAVVVFSSIEDAHVIGALRAGGVRGFVSKSASIRELISAIEQVASGSTVFPETRDACLPHEELSERERLVFEQLILGSTPKEIAYELDLATSSVYTYAERVRRKLGVESTAELVGYAYSVGLLGG